MSVKNPIRRRKPEKSGINTQLGDLEQEIMREVWDGDKQGSLAGDIQRQLGGRHPIALTTVLTTLERLREKGILTREREGKAYRYSASLSEDELQQRIVVGVLDRLIAQFPSAVAAYFAQQGRLDYQGGEDQSLARLAEKLQGMVDTENGAADGS